MSKEHQEAMKKLYDAILRLYKTSGESYRKQEELIKGIFSGENALRNLDKNAQNNQAEKDRILQIILQKVCVLDSLYSTNLAKFGVYEVAKHIAKLEQEKQIHKQIHKAKDYTECQSIVSTIAQCKKLKKKSKPNEPDKYDERSFYSFATKYCFHHNQEAFRIYDSLVRKVLVFFNNGIKDSPSQVEITTSPNTPADNGKNDYNKPKPNDRILKEKLIKIASNLVGTKFFNNKKLIDKKLKSYEKYDEFLCIIDKFAEYYGLENQSKENRRDLDHFLWVFGKECRANNEKLAKILKG